MRKMLRIGSVATSACGGPGNTPDVCYDQGLRGPRQINGFDLPDAFLDRILGGRVAGVAIGLVPRVQEMVSFVRRVLFHLVWVDCSIRGSRSDINLGHCDRAKCVKGGFRRAKVGRARSIYQGRGSRNRSRIVGRHRRYMVVAV